MSNEEEVNLPAIDPAALAAGDQWEAMVRESFNTLAKARRGDAEDGNDGPLIALTFILLAKAQPIVLAALAAYGLKLASENGWDTDPLEEALEGEVPDVES